MFGSSFVLSVSSPPSRRKKLDRSKPSLALANRSFRVTGLGCALGLGKFADGIDGIDGISVGWESRA